jgi:NAD(P)-dependent dehydrogenase (short-subunit alcohol dehydrogenase family)
MGVFDKFALDGKTAIVTGAGRGLGKAMATALAEAGAKIAVVDIDEQNAVASADDLADISVETIAIDANITSETEVTAMIESVEARLGPIDILLNSTGVAQNAPAEETTVEEWQHVIDVNLTESFLCANTPNNRCSNESQAR